MHSMCLKQSSFTFPCPPTSGRSAPAKQTQYLKTSSYLHLLPFSRQPNAHLQKAIDSTSPVSFLSVLYLFTLQTFTDHYFRACRWVWKCREYKTKYTKAKRGTGEGILHSHCPCLWSSSILFVGLLLALPTQFSNLSPCHPSFIITLPRTQVMLLLSACGIKSMTVPKQPFFIISQYYSPQWVFGPLAPNTVPTGAL